MKIKLPYYAVSMMILSTYAFNAQAMSEPPSEIVSEPDSIILREVQDLPVMNNDEIQVSSAGGILSAQEVAFWQGLDHEWKRYIVDGRNGRIPHRISVFSNFVENPSSGSARYHMGQNTGVDGNYMYPVSHSSVVDVSGVMAFEGSLNLNWTDQLSAENEQVPKAYSRIKQTISIPEMEWHAGRSIVFLQGYELQTNCNQSNGELCNSDGIWPYVFHLEIDSCRTAAIGSECDLNVNIHRAWTPNKGGFELIGEVKPINASTDFSLNVHYAALQGGQGNIAVGARQLVQAEQPMQQYGDVMVDNRLRRNLPQSSHAFAAITSLGFALTEPEKLSNGWKLYGSDLRQRGRYIAKQKFVVNNVSYDGDSFNVSVAMGIWSPTTVVDSNVTTELGINLVELNAAGNVGEEDVKSIICINSKPEAPFFSKWESCNRQDPLAVKKFGGQAIDRVDIERPL